VVGLFLLLPVGDPQAHRRTFLAIQVLKVLCGGVWRGGTARAGADADAGADAGADGTPVRPGAGPRDAGTTPDPDETTYPTPQLPGLTRDAPASYCF